MNLIRNAGSIVLIFVLITAAISCQKELHGDGTESNTTTPPPAKACVNCDYLPVCDSSVYVYVDSTASGVDSNTSVVHLLKDTLVSGVKYSGASTLGFFD